MPAKKIIPTATLRRVIRRLKARECLRDALAAEGVSYTLWRRQTKGTDVGVPIKRGRVAQTYTPERVREVQKRVARGEMLRDVCADMAMDPSNLSRWCRRRGLKLFSERARQINYALRDYSHSGPRPIVPGQRTIREQIIALHGRGLTQREMAERVGCTRQTVGAHLRRMTAGAPARR